MNLKELSFDKIILPHQAREIVKNLEYHIENLYENITMASKYAECTYDILYPTDIVPIHTHNFYEISLCESGKAQHLCNGQRFSIQKGDIIIIPPGVRHCPIGMQHMLKPYKRIILFINPFFIEKSFSMWPYYEKHRELFDQPRHFQTLGTPHEKLWKYFNMAALESNTQNPYSDSFLCGITTCLLTKFMKATDTTLEPSLKAEKQLLENIVLYTEEHLSEKIVLNDIAEYFNVSKSYVTKLFRNSMGCSFHEFLIQTRLDETKNLLQRDISLDMIAELTGFGDYSNFYRTFKKEYGMTPSEYRQNLIHLNLALAESNQILID